MAHSHLIHLVALLRRLALVCEMIDQLTLGPQAPDDTQMWQSTT
jgi:hypothetical protein